MRIESLRDTWPRFVAVLLLWLLFFQALDAARAASITFDEGPHLAVGYATLRTRDFRLQPVHIHPPLANVLAAAPLLLDPSLPDPRAVDGWEINSLSAVTDAVVWQNPRPARLALAGRLPIILLTLVAGALVWRWAADLGGPWAGTLALALFALDPNIVAHGSLITTDMAVTAFGLLTFFLLHRHLRRPTQLRLAGVGLALGLALSGKVSAVLLIPLVELVLLLKRRGRRTGLRDGMIVALIAFGVLWAVYGFDLRPLPDLTGPLPLPAATHVEIYRSLQQHYDLGHPAFLMGQNSERGWWFYFPVAFLIKTPLPTLMLLAWALARTWQRRRLPPLTLALFPLAYAVSALFSSVDIGYRHLLPVLPFLYIFIGSRKRGIENRPSISRFTFHVSRVTLYAFLVWLTVGTIRTQPYPLTFFNELAGGPDDGYRWLVDSNLDWGQNLWDLRDWMRDNGVDHVYYSHFSPARPDMYGISADYLPPDPRAVPFAPWAPAPGWYAIGATTLQGVYTPDVNTYAWFRARQPDAVLGHALFLYHVPARSAPDWAAVCLGLPLDETRLRANLDAPDARLLFYDCRQSQVYLAGEGRYGQPADAAEPEGATLELTARRPDGHPLYRLFRAASPPVPDRLVGPIPLDGPLTFLGYRTGVSEARPGQILTLWSYWQIEGAAVRPLSLMAHLVGPDGLPIAIGDGLGYPVEQWQPGDRLLQRHTFPIPADIPPGDYWLQTGAYWLDDGQRWSTPAGDDKILLDKITILD